MTNQETRFDVQPGVANKERAAVQPSTQMIHSDPELFTMAELRTEMERLDLVRQRLGRVVVGREAAAAARLNGLAADKKAGGGVDGRLEAIKIVRAVSRRNAPLVDNGSCAWCSVRPRGWWKPWASDDHDPMCPWRLARDWVETYS